jgi:hypothetical protein
VTPQVSRLSAATESPLREYAREAIAIHRATAAASRTAARAGANRDRVTMAAPRPPSIGEETRTSIGGDVRCLDCHLPYTDFPLDLTLPDEQWLLIHPDGGGVLCANCIVRRASQLPNVVAVRAYIEKG